MKNTSPKPGSEAYNVEKPQDLQQPKFNSATERRSSEELPAVEHINEEAKLSDEEKTEANMEQQSNMPVKPDLGNERDEDEAEKEKIIRR